MPAASLAEAREQRADLLRDEIKSLDTRIESLSHAPKQRRFAAVKVASKSHETGGYGCGTGFCSASWIVLRRVSVL